MTSRRSRATRPEWQHAPALAACWAVAVAHARGLVRFVAVAALSCPKWPALHSAFRALAPPLQCVCVWPAVGARPGGFGRAGLGFGDWGSG